MWATTDIDIPVAFTGTGRWRDGMELLYFSQFPGSKKFATITVNGTTSNAIVVRGGFTKYASGRFYCEYWVEPEYTP